MARATQNRIAALCYRNTGNLGDEIQTIAAARLLGGPAVYFDRDALAEARGPANEKYWMVLNGWFLSRPESWPPASCIHPLFTSLHLSPTPVYGTGYVPRDLLCAETVIEYLRFHAPIGARDTATRDHLLSVGVPSYFSGCMTLTLDARVERGDSQLVVLVDVAPSVRDHVVQRCPEKHVRVITHTDHDHDSVQRMEKAEALLDLYATARLVITSRLHCAMPCVGFGVPVLLLDSQRDTRFSGLRDFCRTSTTSELVSGRCGFDILNPPEPLIAHLPYRARLKAEVAAFRQQFETGIAPQAFELTVDQYIRRQMEIERLRTDLLISIQKRLDAIQGIPNY